MGDTVIVGKGVCVAVCVGAVRGEHGGGGVLIGVVVDVAKGVVVTKVVMARVAWWERGGVLVRDRMASDGGRNGVRGECSRI